jgi:hypothetical protein
LFVQNRENTRPPGKRVDKRFRCADLADHGEATPDNSPALALIAIVVPPML